MMGRGINLAALADEDVLEAPVPSIVRGSAPLHKVAANPLNPRQDVGDVAALADAIRGVGQLQPVTVVHAEAYLQQYPEHAEHIGAAEFVAVTGGRRRAAITALGWTTIDITIKDHLAESRGKLLAAALSENVDRADLNPMDEAVGVQQLVDELDSARAAGEQLGKSRPWVQQRIGLLRLIDELQSLVRNGTMSVRVAREISTLPQDKQLAAWEQERLKGDTAVTPSSAAAEMGDTAVSLPSQRPTPVLRAIRRLGATPEDMASTLRAHLDQNARIELARALLAEG